MNDNATLIWERLPAHLRTRDEEAGGFLRAVVEVLAEGAGAVDADIDALSDDWFVETCAEWVVPYIGDLLGVEGLHPLAGTAALSNRARVADAIRFRRRKGTAAMLEELARTTTGWPARAVEFFEVLSTTQHLNHLRPQAPATATIRDAEAMELVDSPFDTTAHTVNVRPLGAGRSGHNLPNVGLYVWPLASYPFDRASAVAVTDPPDGRWLVDPLGVDHHLAGPTVTEPDIDHRAEEENTPNLLRRRPLFDELNAQRADPVDPALLRWFQPDDPAFEVWIQATVDDPLVLVGLDDLHVCDLSNWGTPTGQVVQVDPVSGRVVVAAGRAVHRLALDWSQAFGADLGALPYPRRGDLGGAEPVPDFQVGVSVTDPLRPGEVVATLGDAVAAWHTWQVDHPGTSGRIVVMDSHRYPESLVAGGAVQVAQGARLSIVAARWPRPPDGGPRRYGAIDPSGVRPAIVGNLEVTGTGTGERPGGFVLDGVLVSGRLTAVSPAGSDDGIGPIEVRHCTLVPGAGGITVMNGNSRCNLLVHRSIVGPVTLAAETEGFTAEDSVVHALGGVADTACHCELTDVTLAGVTVLGLVKARRLSADDTIFTAEVQVTRRQQGCLRFSYVPPGSATPRRYRCQPDLATAAAPGDPGVTARLVPAHVSTDLSHPGYAQLAPFAAVELRAGAESGSEMGAFRSALTPQRLGNLSRSLDEFLPFGRVAAPLPVIPDPGGQP